MATKEARSELRKVSYCILCEKCELKQKNNNLYCLGTKENRHTKVIIKNEATPDDVEQNYGAIMMYCYNCGEELVREEEMVLCVECELVDFKLSKKMAQDKTVTVEHAPSDSSVSPNRTDDHTTVPANTLQPKEQAVQLVNQTTEYSDQGEYIRADSRVHDNKRKYNNTPEHDELMNWVAPEASCDWYNIGIQLKIRLAKLDKIKSNFTLAGNVEQMFSEVMKLWEENPHPERPFIWQTILDVLASRSIEKNTLVQSITEKLTANKEHNTDRGKLPLYEAICQSDDHNIVHRKKEGDEKGKLHMPFRSDIAHNVICANIGLIKNSIDLNLADKLLENRIINEQEKKKVTDRHCGLTADERMDKLLNILASSVKNDGNVFKLFLDMLKQENTLRADGLADKLLECYKNY